MYCRGWLPRLHFCFGLMFFFFLIASCILRECLQSELPEFTTGRILSACSMSMCQPFGSVLIQRVPQMHPFCLLQMVVPACHHTQLAPWLGQLAGLCCLGSGDTSPMQHVSSLKSGLTVRVGHGGKVQFSLPKWSEKKKRSLSWAWQRFGSAGCF